MAEILLEVKDITKIFPGTKALDNVTISVEKGEIHALAGENGAGKSTLINILSGRFPFGSYSGQVFLNGVLCKFHTVKDGEKKGVVVIHQEPVLIPDLSVAENMFFGNERKGVLGIDWTRTFREAASLLNLVGFKEDLSLPVSALSPGNQQLLEIAKALGKNVKLLVLDEPTSALNETEITHLFDLLSMLKADGITSILISHKVKDLVRVADAITVMRDGASIETFSKDSVSGRFDEESISSAMVGRSLTERFPRRNFPRFEAEAPLLEVRDWTVMHPYFEERKVCDGINLTVNKGEIVGLAGLVGSGRSEFAMSVFGKSYGESISGSIFLSGKYIRVNSVRQAIAHRIAYAPGSRDGLFLNDSIAANATLADMNRVSTFSVISRKRERVAAEKMCRKLGIKTLGVYQNVGTLSGGNQSKLLLGKWLLTDPDILMLDEPTGGIDVGAKYEIYTIMNNFVSEGKGVLFISSEMAELCGMCDRIYVMNAGRIVGELSKEDATQEAIMNCILQSKGNQ